MTIQFKTDKPIFLQLAEEIRNSILKGNLKEGGFIPSVRKLSAQFELNPNTVMNSIKNLVDDDILEKKRGLGMRIKNGALERLIIARKQKFFNTDLINLIKEAQLLGISIKEIETKISDIEKKKIS
jgi:GntR family transcriptional regulator